MFCRDFFAAEKEYAALHPVYTRCAAKVDLQKFVENIRKTCGDVHELTTVTGPCKAMLLQKSKDFGCCWESVMQGYTALDPQAAHKWRMWQGTVSGKGGVTFDSDDCGESMGEKGYSDLKVSGPSTHVHALSSFCALSCFFHVLLLSMMMILIRT